MYVFYRPSGDMKKARRHVDQVGIGAPHFRVIVPHPGEPEPGPEVNDIPRCVAKFEGRISTCSRVGHYMDIISYFNRSLEFMKQVGAGAQGRGNDFFLGGGGQKC